MARAETPTKLTLDEWARLFSINPLHFNQIAIPAQETESAICGLPWVQHGWQNADRVGREAVAIAIAEAESNIEDALGFRLAPAWEVDEWRPTMRSLRPENVNRWGTDVKGGRPAVFANWGYFISGGIQAKTLLANGETIVWSSAAPLDDTTYKEIGTIVATVPADTPACEIEAYYPGKAGADAWEIRPISVVVVGAVATITLRRELCVVESLLEAYDPNGVDGLVDANFIAEIDVYRRYNDPQTQATLMWEPSGLCSCASPPCSQCAYGTQTACLYSKGDPRHSIVAFTPATWNATSEQFDGAALAVGRSPEIVRLFYRAGWEDKALPCPRRDMDAMWARTVAEYAAAMLHRAPCECSSLQSRIEYYARDMAFVKGAEELAQYQISKRDLDNPFGTTVGAIRAWKKVVSRRVSGGVGGVVTHA